MHRRLPLGYTNAETEDVKKILILHLQPNMGLHTNGVIHEGGLYVHEALQYHKPKNMLARKSSMRKTILNFVRINHRFCSSDKRFVRHGADSLQPVVCFSLSDKWTVCQELQPSSSNIPSHQLRLIEPWIPCYWYAKYIMCWIIYKY